MKKVLHPRISVIMSVYNGGRFLKAAIDSILNQTFKDFEFIILDDGSDDNSVDIINSFQDERISLHNLNHQGLPSALNYGISISTAQIICRMDSDDIAHSERFEKQLKFLDMNPEFDLCGTSISIIDENDRLIGTRLMPVQHNEIVGTIDYSCNVIHPTYCFKKEIHDSIGGYRKELLYSQDYDYLLRVIDKGFKVCNLPEVLLKYRMINKANPEKTYNQMRFGGLAQKLHYERKKYGKEKQKTLNELKKVRNPSSIKKLIYKSYNFFNKARINGKFPKSLWIFLSFIIAIFDKQIMKLIIGDTKYYFKKGN